MIVDIDTVVQSFGDYYGGEVFRDMSDREGDALAVLIVDVFQGGYPFPERLARSYKIIERLLERRGADPLWKWLFYCGVRNMRTAARDYGAG
jgi:hypothetical protein